MFVAALTTRRCLDVAILLAMAVSVLVHAGSEAFAADDFRVHLCNGVTDRWTATSAQPNSSPNWRLRDDCADADQTKRQISIVGDGPLYGTGSFRYPIRIALKSFSATAIAEPGVGDIQYSVKLCTTLFADCDGRTLTPATTGDYDPTVRVQALATDPGMPMGISEIRVEATCMKPAGETCAIPQEVQCEESDDELCEPSFPFGLVGIMATGFDDVRPKFEQSFSERPADVQNGDWVSKAGGEIRLRTTDSGSGIQYIQVMGSYFGPSSSDSVNFPVYSGCTTSMNPAWFKQMCPPSWNASIPIDTVLDGDKGTMYDGRFRRSGTYILRLRAYDMSGNSAEEFKIEFAVDTAAPPQPSNVRLSGVGATAQDGWIGTTSSIVEWDLPERAYGSLLDTALVDIDPLKPLGDWVDPPEVELKGSSIAPSSLAVAWPGPGTWKVRVRFRDFAGNEGEATELEAKVDYTSPAKPDLDVPGWIGKRFLADDTPVNWSTPWNLASMPSGVCSYRATVTDRAQTSTAMDSDLGSSHLSAPLPGDLGEGNWTFGLQASSCAGKLSPVAKADFVVDLTAPEVQIERPARFWLGPGDEVSVRATDQGGSGVDRVTLTDNGSPRTVDGGWMNSRLAEGVHRLSAHAVDRAKNGRTTEPVEVGVDKSAPLGNLTVGLQGAPTLVTATAKDELSGVNAMQMQYRVVAGGDWVSFRQTALAQGDGESAMTIAAHLPDAEIPPGEIEVRLIATDRLGNRATLGVDDSGRGRRVTVPIRSAPSLTLEIPAKKTCARKAKRLVCQQAKPTKSVLSLAGERVRLTGSLRSGGAPVSNAAIDVTERNQYSSIRRRVAQTVTDRDGAFTVTIAPGTNRTVTASFAGDPLLLPARDSEVKLTTPARATLRVSDRSVHAGDRLLFKGRLLLGAARLTDLGKNVVVQYRAGNEWKPLADGSTDKNGVFSIAYRVLLVSRPLRMTVRLYVNHGLGFPFASGYSRSVKILIKP